MLQVTASTTTKRILLHHSVFKLAPKPPFQFTTTARQTFSTTPRFLDTTNNIKNKMGAPVILCGKTEQIGVGVIAMLKPEYDVIHFIMTPQAGVSQIPAILRGEPSIPTDSELGSKDYSSPPVAVILGGGYTDEDIDLMFKAATSDSNNKNNVPWLRPDLTKPAPPLGPEYGKALVARIKVLLAEMKENGKLGEGKVVWY